MAEPTREDIKFLFQEEVLKKHGNYLMKLLRESIKEKELISTGDLLDIIDFEVVRDGINWNLNFSFYDYGRFIEINRNKHKRASRFDFNVNKEIWGIKENSMKRKKTDWYTRNMYGALNRLIGTLMYEFTEEEIARIKRKLETKIEITI